MRVYPVYNKDKQQAILDYLKAKNRRNYIIYMVGTHTGLRVSDIVKLTAKDFRGNKLQVVEQKTKKTKIIIISSKLRASINDYINNNNLVDGDYLFRGRQSSNNNHISTRRVQQIIKAISSILDIQDNINSHSMRKTFAYNLYVASNYNIALVMQALNHTKEAITLRYLCIADKLLNDIIINF